MPVTASPNRPDPALTETPAPGPANPPGPANQPGPANPPGPADHPSPANPPRREPLQLALILVAAFMVVLDSTNDFVHG